MGNTGFKKRVYSIVILLFFLGVAIALADSNAPDYYQIKIWQGTSTSVTSIIKDWATICDTDPSNDAHDYSGGYNCTYNVGTASSPGNCSVEGDYYFQWRFYDEYAGTYTYTYTGAKDTWVNCEGVACAPSGVFIYNVNYDSDPNDCECKVGAGRYNLGGDIDGTECCTDDAGENHRTRVASATMDNGYLSSTADDACCDAGTDCVDDSTCTTSGSTRNADDDSDVDYCSSGTWYDCNSYTHCAYNGGYKVCSANNCVSCTQNSDCPTGYYCNDDGACHSKKAAGETCDWTVTESDSSSESNGVCSSGYCRDDYDNGEDGDGLCESGEACWCTDSSTDCATDSTSINTGSYAPNDCKSTGSGTTPGGRALCNSGAWTSSSCGYSAYNSCSGACQKGRDVYYCDNSNNGCYDGGTNIYSYLTTAGMVCSAGGEVAPSSGINCNAVINCTTGSCSAPRYYLGCAAGSTSCTNIGRVAYATWNATSNYVISETNYKSGTACNLGTIYCGASAGSCTGSGSPYSCQITQNRLRCNGAGVCNYDSGIDLITNVSSGNVCSGGVQVSGSSTYYAFSGTSDRCSTSIPGSGFGDRVYDVYACNGNNAQGPDVGDRTIDCGTGCCYDAGSTTSCVSSGNYGTYNWYNFGIGDGTATDYCTSAQVLDCNTNGDCAVGYYCSANSCVNTCSQNSNCPSGFFCSVSGICQSKLSNGAACVGATAVANNTEQDGACTSGYCDNDGVGVADDGWCFSPYSTYYDSQENTKCEKSATSVVSDASDEKTGNACDSTSGWINSTCYYFSDGDLNSQTCTCIKGTGYWSIGGEVSSTTCCDDASEYKRTRLVSGTMDNGYSNSTADDACCDANTKCVNSSVCYATGYVSGDADGDGDTDYCNAGMWYDCYNNSNCNTGAGYYCSANNCVNSCTKNSDCLTGFFCNSAGTCQAKLANGAACVGATAVSNNTEQDGACTSGYCDNDGVGVADDGWCFSPYSTYYDSQENTKCEKSATSVVSDASDEKTGNACDSTSGWINSTCYYFSDGDLNSQTCTCIKGTGYWSIGGEVSSTTCCDDASEYKRTRLVSGTMDNGYSNSTADDACCNANTKCVNNSVCYVTGYVSGDADGDGDTDYCNAGMWYDCYNNSNCNTGAGYYCSANNCVNSCTKNSDCLTGFFCNSAGSCQAKLANGATCVGATAVANNTEQDGACTSGYCDNDGVGVADDGWCFSPYSTYYDSQENTKCEKSATSVVSDASDEKTGNACDSTSGWINSTCYYFSDGDSNSQTCTCIKGTGYWSIGGEVSASTCCDDASEYKRTRVTSGTMDNGYSNSTADDACCNANTKCVNNSVCYATGYVSGDADSDGDTDYCNAGLWYDCLDDSNCPSGYYCSSNDCVTLPTPSMNAVTPRTNYSLNSELGGFLVEWSGTRPTGYNYEVQRDNNTQIYYGTAVSDEESNLNDNIRYCYRVRLNNGGGHTSGWSANLCNISKDRTGPASPSTTLTASNDSNDNILINITEQDEGLVLYLPFEEGSGSTTKDWSPEHNDGAISGASWTDGNNDPYTGKALDFEGSDYVTVPPSTFSSISSEITISVWLYGDASFQPQADSIFEARAGTTRVLNAHVPWSTGEVYWDAGNPYDRISKIASPEEYEGKWNHWVFTKNASSGIMRIFLNGKEWHNGTGKTSLIYSIDSFKIGSYYDGSLNYDGIIDEFIMYNRSLTQEEIIDLYQSGLIQHGISRANESSGTYAPVDGIYDDFNDGNTNGWSSNGGTWSVTSGYVDGFGNGGGTQTFYQLTFDDFLGTDFVYEAKVKPLSSGASRGKALVFRWQDSNNFYFVDLEAWSQNHAEIGKRVGGSWTRLCYTPFSWTSKWYNFKVITKGNTIKFYIDDVLLCSATDASFSSSGKIGFMIDYDDEHVYFDDVEVTPLVADINYTDTDANDTSPPDTPIAPTIDATSLSDLQVSWNGVSDNGNNYWYYTKSYDASGDISNGFYDGFMEKSVNQGYLRNGSLTQGSAAESFDSSEKYSGDYSLKVVYSGSSSWWASDFTTGTHLDPDSIYRMSCMVKTDLSSGYAKLHREYTGTILSSTTLNGVSDWSEIYTIFSTESTGNVRLLLYGLGDPSGTIWWDNCELVKLSNTTLTTGVKDYYIAGTGADAYDTSSPYTASGLNCFDNYCYTVAARDNALNLGTASSSTCEYPISAITCDYGGGTVGYCYNDSSTTCYYDGTGCPSCQLACGGVGTMCCPSQGTARDNVTCASTGCNYTDHDRDTSEGYCTSSASGCTPYYWNIGGEVASTTCCEDDSGEYRTTCVGDVGTCSGAADNEACCDASSDCVYNNQCYADSATRGDYVCDSGYWRSTIGFCGVEIDGVTYNISIGSNIDVIAVDGDGDVLFNCSSMSTSTNPPTGLTNSFIINVGGTNRFSFNNTHCYVAGSISQQASVPAPDGGDFLVNKSDGTRLVSFNSDYNIYTLGYAAYVGGQAACPSGYHCGSNFDCVPD